MTETPVSCTRPLQHFVKRLQTAEIIHDPYPHYYLDHVFPDDFYQSLLRHLPGSAAYQNLFEITTLKLDHFRFRDQRDLADGWTASLPDELRRFWDEFNAWFLGPELAQAGPRFICRTHALAVRRAGRVAPRLGGDATDSSSGRILSWPAHGFVHEAGRLIDLPGAG